MSVNRFPWQSSIESKGWLGAQRWLILRRISQLGILALFLLGPWFGIWIVSGNLNASLTLDTLPLTDPLLLVQSLAAGHLPESTALLGGVLVAIFYFIVGGRVFCAWVCPVNLLTDLAHWLRLRFDIRSPTELPRHSRYLLLAAVVLLSALSGQIIWELVNPVSMFHRGVIFGAGLAWVVLLAVFVFDLFVSRHGWCGRLCPVGAFYSLLGTRSLLRVRADRRADCDDCLDCYRVCPEQQVLRPALKGDETGSGPVILSANCTNCGRCIDVCGKNVFNFGLRFPNRLPAAGDRGEIAHHSSGVSAS